MIYLLRANLSQFRTLSVQPRYSPTRHNLTQNLDQHSQACLKIGFGLGVLHLMRENVKYGCSQIANNSQNLFSTL